MAELASAVITAARLEVPGANTTNMPDATLLSWLNSIIKWLGIHDFPRVKRFSGGAGGFKLLSPSPGTRIVATAATNMSRLTTVRYEAGDATTKSGPPLAYLTMGQYELEARTFPGTNGQATRCGHWYKEDQAGAWTLLFLPPALTDDQYYSIEGEIDVADLALGGTLLVSPIQSATLKKLLAFEIAKNLGRGPEFLAALMAQVPDQKMAAKWLAQEDRRGEMVKSPAGRDG